MYVGQEIIGYISDVIWMWIDGLLGLSLYNSRALIAIMQCVQAAESRVYYNHDMAPSSALQVSK